MTEINQLLKTAIQAAKAGEREKAHQLLMQIVEEDIQARTIATMSWQQRFEEIAGNGQS